MILWFIAFAISLSVSNHWSVFAIAGLSAFCVFSGFFLALALFAVGISAVCFNGAKYADHH